MDNEPPQTDRRDPASAYPEPHTGPLGQRVNSARYAQTRKYGSKPEYNLQKRVLIVGLILTVVVVGTIIALVILSSGYA